MVCFVIHRREIWSGDSRKSFLGHLSPPERQPEIAHHIVYSSSELGWKETRAKVPGGPGLCLRCWHWAGRLRPGSAGPDDPRTGKRAP